MQAESFQLKVNSKFEYTLTDTDIQNIDAIRVDDRHFHILKGGKAFRAEITDFDLNERKCRLMVNGSFYEVVIDDAYDKLIQDLGFKKGIVHRIKSIKAPMPGLVISVEVNEGTQVVYGDPMIILEAMKMENIIKSPGEGKVKKILATKGKAVDKGEILIELE
jgi:biotin carboxyl carrier protein